MTRERTRDGRRETHATPADRLIAKLATHRGEPLSGGDVARMAAEARRRLLMRLGFLSGRASSEELRAALETSSAKLPVGQTELDRAAQAITDAGILAQVYGDLAGRQVRIEMRCDSGHDAKARIDRALGRPVYLGHCDRRRDVWQYDLDEGVESPAAQRTPEARGHVREPSETRVPPLNEAGPRRDRKALERDEGERTTRAWAPGRTATGEPRDVVLPPVRVTQREAAEVRRLAEQAGVSVSEWIRTRALSG